MAASSSIGSVNAEFTASTTNFSAAVQDVGASLAATGAKAAAAGQKVSGSFTVMTTAAERARQAWQRELVAQDRAAEAAATAARAMELAALKADILSRADEVLARSAEVTSSKFQLMSAQVREAVSVMGEKITAVAEKAELSADGIASAFGGLGKLLGVGLLGDFVAHTLDNLAELNVTLGDLHEKTGIAVQDLAGLRLMALSKGLDFTTLSMGLTRLGRAMYEAKQGMQEDREAFDSLGISVQEIDSLSIEQMFYRISKAIGENRNLVISDGTALELFGRGGKEVVPMLREWGGGLEAMAKQQAALTGITDESVRASQQWLQATSDLTAEFHGAMVPLLIDMVRAIDPVKTGFYALEAGVVEVFGTIINDALAVVESIGDIGKAIKDLATGHPGNALQDIKSIWTANQKGWQLQEASIRASSLAGMVSYNQIGGSDLTHLFEPGGQNRAGDVDGALLRQAKQQLAAMEQKQKRPLSHQQLIDYWKKILAKAQKGSTDYEQVNLVLGNLMQHAPSAAAIQKKAASADMQQWRQQLEEEKSVQGMTLQQEAQFWLSKASLTRDGARSFADAMNEANKALAAMRGQDFKAQQEFAALGGGPARPTDTPQQAAQRAQASAYLRGAGNVLDVPALKEQGQQTVQFLKSLNEQASLGEKNKNAIAEASLQMAVATGQMDKLTAAKVQAQIHTEEYRNAVEQLRKALDSVAADRASGVLTSIEAAQRSSELNSQGAQMQGRRTIQVLQDQQAIQSQTIAGASKAALDRMVVDWEDMASKIASVLTRTINSFNDDIAKVIMGQGAHNRQQIGTMFGKTFQAAGEGLIKTSLGGAESSILKMFGLGGGKKPTGAQGDPMYVIAANLPGGSAGVCGMLAGFRGLGQQSSISGPRSVIDQVFGLNKQSGAAVPSFSLPGLDVGPSIPDSMPESAATGPLSPAAAAIPGISNLLAGPLLSALGPSRSSFSDSMPGMDDSGDDALSDASAPEPRTITSVTRPQQSGAGNLVSKLVGTVLGSVFQGRFAAGGDIVANRPAIVGENGPELFMPSSSGTIIPNDQIGGTTHQWTIDARGSNDPAQTVAILDRYMRTAAPQIAASAVQGMKEQQLRRPSSAR